MAQTFSGNVLTVTSSNAAAKDSGCVSGGALNLKSMGSPTALAGTNGIDAALIHGDQWKQVLGNRTENILKNLTTTITLNEQRTVDQNCASSIIGNFNFLVVGKTDDTRIGVHHQSNISARFENYAHTLTQDHHEKMVIHQPTTTWDIVNTYFSRKTTAFAVTAADFAAKGTNTYVYALEAACKVISIENKVFTAKKDSFAIKDLDIGLHIRGVVTEIKAIKIKAAASHIKAIGANLCAGIAVNLDSPWA